jgi:hypothetical protein
MLLALKLLKFSEECNKKAGLSGQASVAFSAGTITHREKANMIQPVQTRY